MTMNKIVDRKSMLSLMLFKDQLNPRHFFEELIELLVRKGVFDESEFEGIQQQLLELLGKQIKAFNKGNSSSIRVEVAEALMDSIYYTLSIYFKDIQDLGSSGELIKEKGIENLFNEGKALIQQKVEQARILLDRVQQTKLITANYAYNDTINEGVGLFFVVYDKDFMAQDSPGAVD